MNSRLATFLAAAAGIVLMHLAARAWPTSALALFVRRLDSSQAWAFLFYLVVAVVVLALRIAWEMRQHRRSAELIKMHNRSAPREGKRVTGARILIVGISAVTGACFAALAGLGLSAMAVPVRRFHVASLLLAVVAMILAYVAFRAAMAGNTDDETAMAALWRGMLGAFAGLIVIVIFLAMFRADTQALLAHALGKPASAFTVFRLVVASVLLGFGTGFVVRLPKSA